MQQIYFYNEYIILMLEKAVYKFKGQSFEPALREFMGAIRVLNSNIESIVKNIEYFNEYSITVDIEYITNMLANVTEAQNKNDYILMADLIELQLIQVVKEWQNVIMMKAGAQYIGEYYEDNLKYLKEYDETLYKLVLESEIKEDEYAAELTTSGRATIKVINGKDEFYIEGNNDPAYDAYIFAEKYYSIEKYKYIMFGLGLCYKANELIAKDIDEILVYESDINIIRLACKYGNLFHLSTKMLKLFYDPDYTRYSKAIESIDNDTELIMNYASIKNIRNENVKARFEQLFIVDGSIRNQMGLMNSNFRSNLKYCKRNVDELKEKFTQKDVYIIAAGPSLDKNIDMLKNKPKNGIILAVGTVYRKLIKLNISVDYVVISDANKRIIGQIAGLEQLDIPLILLSTVYKEFAKIYKGETYIVFQKDFDNSEKYAAQNGYNTYKAGGSVTTVALDVSISLGAKRVIFVGLDLAYTDNLAHAVGTSRREHKGTEGLTKVASVDGKTVYANNSFILVREWIERRIDKENSIEFIDATEGGSRIKGTKVVMLEELLS